MIQEWNALLTAAGITAVDRLVNDKEENIEDAEPEDNEN